MEAEIAIVLRVVAHDRPGENRQVTRGGQLAGVRQPMGIDIAGLGHPQLAGFQCHLGSEPVLGAADVFGQCHGHIIGAAHRSGPHGVVNGYGLAGGEPQFGRRLAGCV